MTLRLLALLAVLSTGCIGGIRNTSTPRSANEMLLISTAAERAVAKYDAAPLAGRKVFVDVSKFDSPDKNYVVSSLRHHLAKAKAVLAEKGDAGATDLVLQVRDGTLGIWDGDFTLGVPGLQISGEGFGDQAFFLPPLYAFRRLSAQGFAKFQLWTWDPATSQFVARSEDLWGHAFYNRWWVLGLGPFDGSNDVFPDELPEWEQASARLVKAEE